MARLIAVWFLLTLSVPVGAEVRWSGLRDAVVHLHSEASDAQLELNWRPAWQSEANAEQLYLIGPRGDLTAQVDVLAESGSGTRTLRLAGAGDHQLVVPGYSFRRYTLAHGPGLGSQIEPARWHVSIEVPAGLRLYFRVPARAEAVLFGKHHGDVTGMTARRTSDGQRLALPLKRSKRYGDHQRLALPVSEYDQIWELRFEGRGKAAFWLEGAANRFAQTPEHLQHPDLAAGQVALITSSDVIGPVPLLGVALPYALPPESAYSALDHLAPQAANYYSFVDVINRAPGRELRIRQLYAERFGIDTSITLLAGTNRRAVLPADRVTLAGLDTWLEQSRQLGRGTHYLSFADEPNLNYPDYASYAAYFKTMLARFNAHPEARAAGVRLALPASSRWLNGPFRDGAGERRGIDWARRLLSEHGDAVDALVWHEWMVRDLYATRRYRDSVRHAADLVGLDAQGRPNKALILGQTNISSGADLSPAQQNTHFAALWWAAVVINASLEGQLGMLNWFHAADEPDYPKGMLSQEQDRFTLKPVAQAHSLIRSNWSGAVMGLQNSSFEVDALVLGDGRVRRAIGVNKSRRIQQVRLSGEPVSCEAAVELTRFDERGRPFASAAACKDGQLQFDLPGETLFFLTWRTP